jgi:hypothetical protein
VEYGLIIAAVAVAVLFVVFMMGTSLERARSSAGDPLGSESRDAGRDALFIRTAPTAVP